MSEQWHAAVKLGKQIRTDLELGEDQQLNNAALRINDLLDAICKIEFDADAYVIETTGLWEDPKRLRDVSASIQGQSPFRELSIECTGNDESWWVNVTDATDDGLDSPEPRMVTLREFYWADCSSASAALEFAARALDEFWVRQHRRTE